MIRNSEIGSIQPQEYFENRLRELLSHVDNIDEQTNPIKDEISFIQKCLHDYRESNLNSIKAHSKINYLRASDRSALKNIKWRAEALRFIKQKNEVLLADDIFHYITYGLSIPDDKVRPVKSILSNALSALKKSGELKSCEFSGRKGYLYGLPYMFNGNDLKDEYRPMQFTKNKKGG